MRTFDLSPLYGSTVGFDQLFNMFDSLAGNEPASYPPYNIERTGENAYRVTLAVAGFQEENLEIEAKENVLTIRGVQNEQAQNGQREVLYQGIAGRSFERRFQLAEHVEVSGANMDNGLLHIDLLRHIPERMKPRKIGIGKPGPEQIEGMADKRRVSASGR